MENAAVWRIIGRAIGKFCFYGENDRGGDSVARETVKNDSENVSRREDEYEDTIHVVGGGQNERTVCL